MTIDEKTSDFLLKSNDEAEQEAIDFIKEKKKREAKELKSDDFYKVFCEIIQLDFYFDKIKYLLISDFSALRHIILNKMDMVNSIYLEVENNLTSDEKDILKKRSIFFTEKKNDFIEEYKRWG